MNSAPQEHQHLGVRCRVGGLYIPQSASLTAPFRQGGLPKPPLPKGRWQKSKIFDGGIETGVRSTLAPTVSKRVGAWRGSSRLLQGTAGLKARIRSCKQIVLTPVREADTKPLAPVRNRGSGCSEQKWKAQPYISPEPTPDASLVSFCAGRKKLASADAK